MSRLVRLESRERGWERTKVEEEEVGEGSEKRRTGTLKAMLSRKGRKCLGGRGVVVLYMEGAMLPDQAEACIGRRSYSCRLRPPTLSFLFPNYRPIRANLLGKLDAIARPRISTSVKVMPVQQAGDGVPGVEGTADGV